MEVTAEIAASSQPLNTKLTTYVGTKIYRALLTQAGGAAPTATVLENTLGGTVVWTRGSVGDYTATLASAFTTDKTFVTVCASGGVADALLTANHATVNTVQVFSKNTSTDALADELLAGATCEIIVYP